jgi:hypothetical protein
MPLSLKRQRPPSAPPWSRLSALLGLFAQEFDVVLIDNDDRIAPLAFVVDNLPHNDREFRPHFLMNVRWLGSSILQLDVQAIDPLIGSSFDGDTGVAAHGFELVEEAGKLKSGEGERLDMKALTADYRVWCAQQRVGREEAVTHEGLDAAGLSLLLGTCHGFDMQEPDGWS